MPSGFSKPISLLISFCLILEQGVFAQSLDLSAHFANFGRSIAQTDKFRPLHLRYLGYDNLQQDFKLLLDKGDTKKEDLENKAYLEENTQTLLKYFFVGLALPNDKFWVNLRPDSPENILDPDLEKTDIGRIFLEADLQLKKDTASFTSPQTREGKAYWDKLYQKAGELFGTENITIPTITRPWIVPNEIIIRESLDDAYIYKATLKVMLEEDYLQGHTYEVQEPHLVGVESVYSFSDPRLKELNQYSTQLIKDLIIPKLTYEVNTSKRYAPLRQVYYSLILAQWFKQRFKGRFSESSSLLGRTVPDIDSRDLTNLTSKEPYDKQTYFRQYQKSFKDGEYNLNEPVSTPFGQSIRRYMSGGMMFGETVSSAIEAGRIKGNNLHKGNVLYLTKASVIKPFVNPNIVFLGDRKAFTSGSPLEELTSDEKRLVMAIAELLRDDIPEQVRGDRAYAIIKGRTNVVQETITPGLAKRYIKEKDIYSTIWDKRPTRFFRAIEYLKNRLSSEEELLYDIYFGDNQGLIEKFLKLKDLRVLRYYLTADDFLELIILSGQPPLYTEKKLSAELIQSYIANPSGVSEEEGQINQGRLTNLFEAVKQRPKLVWLLYYLNTVKYIKETQGVEIVGYISYSISEIEEIIRWFPKDLIRKVRTPIKLTFEDLGENVAGRAGVLTVMGIGINNGLSKEKVENTIWHELVHKFSLSSNKDRVPLVPVSLWKDIARAAGFYGVIDDSGNLVSINRLPDDLESFRRIGYGKWLHQEKDGNLVCYVTEVHFKELEKSSILTRYKAKNINVKVYPEGGYWMTTPFEAVAEFGRMYIRDSSVIDRLSGKLRQAGLLIADTLFVVPTEDNNGYYRYTFRWSKNSSEKPIKWKERLGEEAFLNLFPNKIKIISRFIVGSKVTLEKIDMNKGSYSLVRVGVKMEGTLTGNLAFNYPIVLKGGGGNTSNIKKIYVLSDKEVEVTTESNSVYRVVLSDASSSVENVDEILPSASSAVKKGLLLNLNTASSGIEMIGYSSKITEEYNKSLKSAHEIYLKEDQGFVERVIQALNKRSGSKNVNANDFVKLASYLYYHFTFMGDFDSTYKELINQVPILDDTNLKSGFRKMFAFAEQYTFKEDARDFVMHLGKVSCVQGLKYIEESRQGGKTIAGNINPDSEANKQPFYDLVSGAYPIVYFRNLSSNRKYIFVDKNPFIVSYLNFAKEIMGIPDSMVEVKEADILELPIPGQSAGTLRLNNIAAYIDIEDIPDGWYEKIKISIVPDGQLIVGYLSDSGNSKLINQPIVEKFKKILESHKWKIEEKKDAIVFTRASSALEVSKFYNKAPGGIDFNALPIVTQQIKSLQSLVSSPLSLNPNLDFDKEWTQIQQIFNADIRLSVQRLVEFSAASASSPAESRRIEDVLGLIADLLRQEEESQKLTPTDPALKGLLITLESERTEQ